MQEQSQPNRPEDLQKVLDISRAMVATEDLDALLHLIIQRSMELLDAERATVFLYDATNHELVSRIAAGANEIRIPADTGIAGAAVQSGQVVNVPDAYADKRFNPQVDRATGFQTRNILSIPLRDYHGQLVGVLQVLNKRAGCFQPYDITLAETLAAQAGVAIQRANLITHYVQKQEMERAMQIARDIQRGLLPKAPPQIEGFEVAGFSQPADETGGDTYDFLALPNGQWMFTIADATGHGIGPALVIASTRAMLRAICLRASREPQQDSSDVSAVLQATNDLLACDLDDGRFVTCFLGLLDPVVATLTFASAGHGPLIFYDKQGDAFHHVSATSIPLGVIDGMDYSETLVHRFTDRGDMAVILTDGFFEAVNPAGEEFGVERVCQLLRKSRGLTPVEMIDVLHVAICDFAAGKPQADDLTAVVIRKN